MTIFAFKKYVDMRKLFFLLLLVYVPLVAAAKWTLVPNYSAAIATREGNDSVYIDGKLSSLYLDDSKGEYRIAVIHETLTMERIKYIKRMESSAAWSGMAAVVAGASSLTGNWRARYFGKVLTFANASLSSACLNNAEAAKVLEVEVYFENTSSRELMVADIDRGRVWYVAAGTALNIKLANPDILQLRISDLNSSRISYATVGAGSELKQTYVEYETPDDLIFPIRQPDENDFVEVTGYMRVHKSSGEHIPMSKEEFKEYKKAHK